MNRPVRAPCPVCGVRMPARIDKDDFEHEACPDGHFAYTYRYKAFTWKIGRETFTWPFKSSAEHAHGMEQKVQDAIAKLRETLALRSA